MKIKDGEIENETGRRKRIQIKYLYINKLHDIKMEHEKINTQKGRKVERYKAGRIGEEENKKNGWRFQNSQITKENPHQLQMLFNRRLTFVSNMFYIRFYKIANVYNMNSAQFSAVGNHEICKLMQKVVFEMRFSPSHLGRIHSTF